MAWTDSSRTTLIEHIKERPVLWDRALQADPNARMLRHEALVQVVDVLNAAYYPHLSKQLYTQEEVRSQWKNLKDTYKRKQRWLSEGKYSRDPAEEPTWKFFRQLRFLDHGKEDGPLREDGASSNEAPDPSTSIPTIPKFEQPNISHGFEEANSIDFLLKAAEVVQRPADKFVNHQLLNTIPTIQQDLSSQPKRMRSSMIMPTVIPTPAITNHLPSITSGTQDDFGHFGQLVGVTLRRLANEGHRVDALRLQKQISDLMFDAQLRLLEDGR